jgi:steroid delta-isomerase
MTATADQISATIARYMKVFTDGDKDGYVGTFAPDATVEDPVGSGVRRGSAEIAEFWELTRSLSPSITLVPVGSPRIAGGEGAFAMQAIAEVGDAKMVVDIIDVMSFDDDGRITSMRAYWDPGEMRPYEG